MAFTLSQDGRYALLNIASQVTGTTSVCRQGNTHLHVYSRFPCRVCTSGILLTDV